MSRDDDEWAEDHGFIAYRCPRCHRRFHTDSAVECPYCGTSERNYHPDEEDEPEPPEPPQFRGTTITELIEQSERLFNVHRAASAKPDRDTLRKMR